MEIRHGFVQRNFNHESVALLSRRDSKTRRGVCCRKFCLCGLKANGFIGERFSRGVSDVVFAAVRLEHIGHHIDFFTGVRVHAVVIYVVDTREIFKFVEGKVFHLVRAKRNFCYAAFAKVVELLG